ncbi:MAG: hypothetical protein E7662_13300 [Ruminococcaceae bacterium]|nr:hypothetical protein [Oscillospiraceae bacterium]
MRFLIMTDIEGVTGITTFPQAERGEIGREMLMHDLKAVLAGMRDAGAEVILYDMHTDGRNIDLSEVDCPVVEGKPILAELWRGVGGKGIDGLCLLGLHTMQHVPGALLAHSYLREYDAIYLNGLKVGEIGIEAALAGEQGVPLVLVTGDDRGCAEAEALVPGITTCAVKKSLGLSEAICYPPSVTGPMLRKAAAAAARTPTAPFIVKPPYEIRIEFSECPYLHTMKRIHSEIFENENTVIMRGDNLLKIWSEYLIYEKEMVTA